MKQIPHDTDIGQRVEISVSIFTIVVAFTDGALRVYDTGRQYYKKGDYKLVLRQLVAISPYNWDMAVSDALRHVANYTRQPFDEIERWRCAIHSLRSDL